MSEAVPVRGIIVGHGEMPRGLVDAVRRIAGEASRHLIAVSNEGKAPDALRAELEAAAGSGPAVLFVDIESGSCGVAAAYACRDSRQRAVVCGVNLPMLLDFVFHAHLPPQELVARVVDRGRAAIRATAVGG